MVRDTTARTRVPFARRCPSDKKPKSPVSAVAVSLDEATMAVGCEDGSLHGMKLSQGGVGVQHTWSKPPAAAGASATLAMDMSTDSKVGRAFDATTRPLPWDSLSGVLRSRNYLF